MNNRSQFAKGRGVFTCCTCGRSTRTVDQGDSECCPQCFELAGEENMVQDGYADDVSWTRVDELIADAIRHGGNRGMIEKSFAILLEGRPQPAAPANQTSVLVFNRHWNSVDDLTIYLHGRKIARGEPDEVEDIARRMDPRFRWGRTTHGHNWNKYNKGRKKGIA